MSNLTPQDWITLCRGIAIIPGPLFYLAWCAWDWFKSRKPNRQFQADQDRLYKFITHQDRVK